MSGTFEKITPVNGFDSSNSDNARQNNYAWSMEEMGDYIYVGTGRNIVYSVFEAGAIPGLEVPPVFVPKNVDMNAEIWRYRKDGSAEWEMVCKAPAELAVIGFRFMIRYTSPKHETALYAGCYTAKPGIVVFKSSDGINWKPLATAIQGSSTRAMIIHNGTLYMGVLKDPASGETMLYSSNDPENEGWSLVNTQGEPDRNPRGGIVTMASFNGHIYVGTSPVGGFEIWRTEGAAPKLNEWKLVVDRGAGDALNEVPLTMAAFRNRLYVGTAITIAIASVDPARGFVPPKPFDLIRINTEDEWKVIIGGDPVLPTDPVTGDRNEAEYPSGLGDLSNGYCWQLRQYGSRFYLGTWDWSDLLPSLFLSLIKSDPADMKPLLALLGDPAAAAGLFTDYNMEPLFELLKDSVKDSLKTMGFDLYVSEDGEKWKALSLNGLGNPDNYGLRNIFVSSDNRLYLGTANPFQGCEVWERKHVD